MSGSLGSVSAQLVDALAFHLALTKIGKPLDQISGTEAADVMAVLGDGETLTVTAAAPSEDVSSSVKVWSWTHAPGELHAVRDATCRSSAYGWEAFTVLDKVEMGLADGTGIKPEVEITLMDGAVVTLPLDLAHLHSRWHVDVGHTEDNDHRFWPIAATLDQAVVMAFAYTLDGTSPVKYEETDPREAEALGELEGGGGGADWGAKICTGTFMPRGAGAGIAPAAEIGGTASGEAAAAPAVLVVLSFTTCTPRVDFEPGGFAYFAKLYPHVMVKATIPLKSIRAAAKLTRPQKTTPAKPAVVSRELWTIGDEHMTSGCHDDTNGSISALFVTDTNVDRGPSGSFYNDVGPFWSDIFSYYNDDFGGFPSPRYQVVKRTAGRRSLENYGEVHTMLANGGFAGVETTLMKEPRQGDFDNMHLAPSLKLPTKITHADVWGLGNVAVDDRAAWRADVVSMAPVCSHDCLHTHWRWGAALHLNRVFTYGWSAEGAYRAPGAPMVPLNHDVWATATAPNELLYEGEAGPEQTASGGGNDSAWIPANGWQVFCHHGSGYVVDFNGTAAYTAVVEAVGEIASVWFIAESEGGLINPGYVNTWESMAVYYWHLRYRYDAGQVKERVLVWNLEEAINL
ncbi:MAG: hypothetical protein ACKVQA_26495 [Burkholderiales bacterium]